MKNVGLITLLLVSHFFFNACTTNSRESDYVENAEHKIIYSQPGRFAGWPANNGAAIFNGNEIVVGFTEATYKLSDSHNSDGPYLSWLARSTNGGETWTTYDPENYVGDLGNTPELKTLDTTLHFKNPGFLMRVVGDSYHGAADKRAHFFYSYDTGKTWEGPFSFGDLSMWPELIETGLTELTPRTDYIVKNDHECLLFFSARQPKLFGTDRLFCIKTTDGGKNFEFVGWVVPPAGIQANREKVDLYEDTSKNPYADECRAVMSQSKMLDNGVIVSVIRRKFVSEQKEELHWIDAYQSADHGKTWSFLAKIADTGASNGNPPGLAITNDGRLCMVYGERNQGSIRVTYSSDQGKTWSKSQILMDGFWSEDMELNDLGYPRVLSRNDGQMVAVYYYSTKENLHHLRATIWKP